MKNTIAKYIIVDSSISESCNEHWEFCTKNQIPRILVIKSGIKYWEIDFDLLPINKSAKFTTSDFEEYLRPLYDLYCTYAKLPSNKFSFGNFRFRVYKNDALDIAEKLFDLIAVLSQKD